MSSHLSSGRINVAQIREAARRELLFCLDKRQGTKAIIWDEKLMGPIGLLAEYSLLKEHQVVQMFQLRAGKLPPVNAQHIFYLVRAKLSIMKIIAENVMKEENRDRSNREFHVVFVPRRSSFCERKLQDLGVFGSLIIEEINVELFPLDCDVLSMELDSAFRECHLENDFSSMFHVANAIMMLQTLYGFIPHVYGQGKCAKIVFDLICRMRRELGGREPQITPQIDGIFLIDREVDLLSPFVTQLTYEGLLDEIFGISHNTVKLPSEKFLQHQDERQQGSSQSMNPSSEFKTFILNSAEELFAKIRDKNFHAVGPTLSRTAKHLSAQFEERHKAQSVGEIRQFVEKLPYLQTIRKSLANHTSTAELIKEVTDTKAFMDSLHTELEFINGVDTDKVNPHIEECIARQEPITKVLRLICVQCFTNNGLKPKILDYYKREIIQTYGYQHILTLINLEKVGILKTYGSYGNRTYSVQRKTLKLTVEEPNEQTPVDIAYVHSGYAPLSIRLAQFLAHPGWRAITDVLKILPEPTIDEIQQIPVGLRKRRNSGTSIQSGLVDDQRVILVFFLGGCTFAEIAALRFLSQQEDLNVEFLVATTKIINGDTFFESLTEQCSSVK